MDQDVKDGLKELYEVDPGARGFFQWAAARQNDATQTTIERLSQTAGVDRRKAVELAKELDRLGCGDFVVGRRGAPSRIEWRASLRSIGKAAIGQAATIDSVDPELVADSADLADLKKDEELGDPFTVIAEAKKRLAAAFGIAPEAVEITIRA